MKEQENNLAIGSSAGYETNYIRNYENLVKFVSGKLSPKRFRHSLGVATTAVELAVLHQVDLKDAFVAGICHDVAKELPQHTQKALLSRSALKDDAEIQKNMPLWHGPAGCVLLQDLSRTYEEISPEVIDACLWHTVGKAQMCPLEAIIFLADMIEPARTWEGVDQLRALAKVDLDKAVCSALETNFVYLAKKEKEIYSGSLLAYEYYKKQRLTQA